jgi:hypothetical protein
MSHSVFALCLLALSAICFTVSAQHHYNDFDLFEINWVPGQPLPQQFGQVNEPIIPSAPSAGIGDGGAGGDGIEGAVDTTALPTAPIAADETQNLPTFASGAEQGGAKAPLYRQLPSQTAPAQFLPVVVNHRYIQQPIYQHRIIDQPIQQQRFISQPVLVGRQIYQPVVRKIHDQTIVQPHVIQGTTITPHVIEQPVIQKQYRQQDTYQQGYQEQHGVEPTQTMPSTFQSTAPQTAGKQHGQAQTQEPFA